MAAAEQITCPMCGFTNAASDERCHSCGARVEELRMSYSPEEAYKRRYQQSDFVWKWALVAAGVMIVLQAIVLSVLPMLIPAYDPQGVMGLILSVPVFFVAGLALGLITPGKTFVEPAVGAMIAALPTLALVANNTPRGFEPTMLAYVVCAVLGVMNALLGAFAGERLQMNSRPHRT